jgi:hypothetical protein
VITCLQKVLKIPCSQLLHTGDIVVETAYCASTEARDLAVSVWWGKFDATIEANDLLTFRSMSVSLRHHVHTTSVANE